MPSGEVDGRLLMVDGEAVSPLSAAAVALPRSRAPLAPWYPSAPLHLQAIRRMRGPRHARTAAFVEHPLSCHPDEARGPSPIPAVPASAEELLRLPDDLEFRQEPSPALDRCVTVRPWQLSARNSMVRRSIVHRAPLAMEADFQNCSKATRYDP